MGGRTRSLAVDSVGEQDLVRLAAIFRRQLFGRPHLSHGSRPVARRRGIGFEFQEYRGYAPGDEVRSIDWRASARAASPQVRSYLDEVACRWWILLDASASMEIGSGAKRDLAAQLAAAWAYVLLDNAQRAGFLAFEGDTLRVLPPGSGRTQFMRIAEQLRQHPADCRPGGGRGTDLAACAPCLTDRSTAVVISDFVAPDALCRDLDALLATGAAIHAVHIASPEDRSLPALEAATLRDVETGETLVLGLPPEAAMEAAGRSLAQVDTRLRAHCRGRGVPLSRVETGQDWQQAMLAHLGAMVGGRP